MSESYPFAPRLGHMPLPPDCQGDNILWSPTPPTQGRSTPDKAVERVTSPPLISSAA